MIQLSLFDAPADPPPFAFEQARPVVNLGARVTTAESKAAPIRVEKLNTEPVPAPFVKGQAVKFMGREYRVRFAFPDGDGWRATLETEESGQTGPFYVHAFREFAGEWCEGDRPIYAVARLRIEEDGEPTFSPLKLPAPSFTPQAPDVKELRRRLFDATEALERVEQDGERYMEILGELRRDVVALSAMEGRCPVASAWPRRVGG